MILDIVKLVLQYREKLIDGVKGIARSSKTGYSASDLEILDDWLSIEEKYLELEKLVNRLSNLENENHKLEKLLDTIENLVEIVEMLSTKINEKGEAIKTLLSTLEVCPFCGGKITDGHNLTGDLI